MVRSERIRSHAERSAIGKLEKESVIQRQESERSTGHPVLLDIGTYDTSSLGFGGKFPPADATTRGDEAVQIYTARLSVSSEPTIRSTTFPNTLSISRKEKHDVPRQSTFCLRCSHRALHDPCTAARAEDEDRNDIVQTNLVSDIPGLATITDRELLNPWGISHSPTSPVWISNQATSTSTLYSVTDETNVSKVNLTVAIPKTAQGPQGPTGQVSNTNTSSFLVNNGGDGGSAHFIFANLNGTISAWDTGPTAFIQATIPRAVYTALAINGPQTRLYAANGAGSGSVDVVDSSFAPLSLAAGAFVDPSLPTGLVPFHVRGIGGDVSVVYAPRGRPAEINAPLGAGAVAIFDEDGNFIKELVSGSRLA